MNATLQKALRVSGLLLAGVFLFGAGAFLLYFLLFALLFGLIGALVAPFTGFTFTDAIDFGPLVVIGIALVGLALRHAVRPYPDAWLRFARRAASVLAVLPPMIYLAVLYAIAWCAAQALGHSPRPMLDDPSQILRNYAPYQQMRPIVHYTEAFAGATVWAWGLLLLHLRRRLTPKEWGLLAVLFFASWLVFMYEPGARFRWWMD